MNESLKKLYKKMGYIKNKKSEMCTSRWKGCTDLTSCENCSLYEEVHLPRFLPHRQLELLELLMRHEKTEVFCRYMDGKYRVLVYTEDCCANAIEDSFEEALASVTCDVWGLFSKEEKKEIRSILKGVI